MPNYRAMARRSARRYGLDPGVFERQIQQESGFQTGRSSSKGAQGIAQIMPQTARGWGINPNNPRQALDAAAKHMAGYVKQYGGYENALRAYNAGPGAIKASKSFPETNHYVATILSGRHPKKLGASRGGGSRGGGGRIVPGTVSLGALGTAANVAAALTPGAQETSVPTLTAPALPEILTPKGYTPVDVAPMPERPTMKTALDQLSQMQDPLTKIKTTPDRRIGGGGGGGGGGTRGGTRGIKGSQIKELIYNDGGRGFGIKDGQTVDGASFYSKVWAGHKDHVHVAAGPKTTVRLGKLAQSMGLHVGENPHFGGVSPVHVKNSNHYKGEAIDVSSNDPAKMRRFARAVARYQRRR
jgi:hypothetical protein